MRIENSVSIPNSTTIPLAANASFTGRWENVENVQSVVDTIYGGLVFTEKSDIVIRCDLVSGNNVVMNAGYDLILVEN